MADLADVSDTLAALIAGSLYPNGTSQPSVTGVEYAVYPGWPAPNCLTDAIKAGKVHISVFPLDNERNTTRYNEEGPELRRNDKTITATVDGNVITLDGTVTTPQTVAALVNNQTVAYAVQNGQTLEQIAAGLATLITNAVIPASSVGRVITVPNATRVGAGVGVRGEKARYLRHQDRQFMVTIWAPNHALRVATAKVVDPMLERLDWIMLPDLTHGRNIHVAMRDSDEAQEVSIFRRDIIRSIDYPTIDIEPGVEVIIGEINTSGSQYAEGPVTQTNVHAGG